MKVKKGLVGEIRLNSLFATMLGELQNTVAFRSGDPACIRMVQRAKKKARYVKKELRQQAVDGFLADNRYVDQRKLTCDIQVLRDARHFITTVLENVTTAFDAEEIQNPLNFDLLFDLWKFGPGASNGIKGTHAAEKVEQEMTCTARCAPLVFKLRQLNIYFKLNDERKGSVGVVEVQGSRLTTVPKNEDTERTIAVEPLGNMALQLAAGSYLEMALRRIGCDIKTQQPKNRLLANRGSIDGSIATIDLKSASNLYGVDLIRLLLPEPWVKLLSILRSEFIELPDGTQERLHMVSTMGNGFTFPLMTLINCALIYGYRAQRGGPNLFIDWTSTAVFGDDIIVPTCEYHGICELLKSVGLIVNVDKSYSEGSFRESCGGDFDNGRDITPFYVKSLSNDSEVYTVINQLHTWSARNNIWLPHTGLALRRMLQGEPLFIPEWMNPEQGILTALVPKRFKYLSVKASRRKLVDSNFQMMLASGGYLESAGLDCFYMPRQFKTEHVIKKSRLPNGYPDGSDPLTRSESATFNVATFVASLYHENLLLKGIAL